MNYAKGEVFYDQPAYRDLRDMFASLARTHGDEPAFAYRLKPKGETLFKSFRCFQADVEAFGTACLTQALVRPGDCVAILGENSYAWAVVHTAVLCGLGRSVPLDKQLAEPEVTALCRRCEATVLCIDAAHEALIEPVRAACPSIRSVVRLHAPETEAPLSDHPGEYSFGRLLHVGREALARGEEAYRNAPIDPRAGLGLYFTSGTTSQSKGVLLSHVNILSNFRNGLRSLHCKPGSRCLSILPIHHTFENTVGLYAQLSVHNCVYFNDGLRYFLYNMKDWKIEVILAVPLLLENIYKQLRNGIEKSGKAALVRRLFRLSGFLRSCGIDVRRKLFAPILREIGGHLQLIIAGAAALSPEIVRFFDGIGVDCMLGYGLTESGPMICANSQKRFRPGSVGTPLADHEVRIENGLDFSDPDHPGEVLARTASIMVGYFRDPEATAAAVDPEGWLHTGDVGYLDKDGFLYLTGRQKSMIVLTNGKKVFPEEIENLLQRTDGIVAAYVWGEENARGNIDTCASLLVAPDKLPAELRGADDAAVSRWLQERITACNDRMPPYKAIKYFVWSTEGMPMTTTLKVRRSLEAARIRSHLEAMGRTMREADGVRLHTAGGKA